MALLPAGSWPGSTARSRSGLRFLPQLSFGNRESQAECSADRCVHICCAEPEPGLGGVCPSVPAVPEARRCPAEAGLSPISRGLPSSPPAGETLRGVPESRRRDPVMGASGLWGDTGPLQGGRSGGLGSQGHSTVLAQWTVCQAAVTRTRVLSLLCRPGSEITVSQGLGPSGAVMANLLHVPPASAHWQCSVSSARSHITLASAVVWASMSLRACVSKFLLFMRTLATMDQRHHTHTPSS